MSQDVQAFNSFPPVPSPGKISLFEAEAKLHALTSNSERIEDCTPFTDILNEYHNINGNKMKAAFPHRHSEYVTTANIKTFIMPEDLGLMKGLWTSMMDNGLEGMQEYLQNVHRSSGNDRLAKILDFMAAISSGYYYMLRHVSIYAYPHYKMGPEELIETFAPIRDWKSSWIRALAWHPTCPQMGIALNNDTVRIYTNGIDVVPMVRSEDQNMISYIAFRPHIQTEIAVAVEKGVLIWEINTSHSIKPRKKQSNLYTVKGHSPVSCVSYSNSGDKLLSSSPMDNSIIVWLRIFSGYEYLSRVSGGGVPLAMWSPDDSTIFSTTPTSIFRLWDMESKCNPRNWNTSGKPVEAACWSPCSTMIMFACDSYLYIMHMEMNDLDKFLNQTNSKSKIVPIFDLRECLVSSEDGLYQYKVGGRVRQLVWDQTGTRVALFFDDSELIPIFRVQPRAVNFLDPIGFVRGHPGDYPVSMAFQTKFNNGAILAIAFVSGRFQYLPLLFVNPKMQKNIFHMDNYRLPIPVTQSRYSTSEKEVSNKFATFIENAYSETGVENPDNDLAEPPRLFSTSM